MNRLTFAFLLAACLCGALSSSAQSDADMKAMMAYANPGPIHQMLAKSVGTWKGDITTWMQPGAPPMTTAGETTNQMILGGRYLQSKNTGNFMGMPFEGIGVIGYDNAKKVFVNSWIDNMGTGMMYLTGTWDAATKSITFTGTMVDPTAGGDVKVKEVMKMVDDNTQILEMYSITGGKEFKNMEIKYTRK
ncbi:MAG: DUF1579 domain-containing protein [Bacteroidetes bacterium]|nr:DUF1579 domain-containing protein [Bacteroidota bacterium]